MSGSSNGSSGDTGPQKYSTSSSSNSKKSEDDREDSGYESFSQTAETGVVQSSATGENDTSNTAALFGFDLTPDAIANNGQLSTTSPDLSSSSSSFHRRSPSINTHLQAAKHINQLQYNHNRLVLKKSIELVVEMLQNLQEMNRAWPVYYPRDESESSSSETKPASDDQIQRIPSPSPRLVSSSTRNFQIFKLDLKFDGSSQGQQLLKSLEKNSVASLLEGKIIQTLKHLDSLRERINDTSSKVLVTGDLNAGKSTFCNALLRRKVLPEDQQPCTNVFCEVKDCRENDGIEEVHAVILGRTYDRLDGATYEIFTLDDLDHLVGEYEKYSILKVYVDDKRPPHQSLLRNGIVDISIIDAPGLNLDSYQTTQLFARQEEIDLVVFVVSAENHFTLSAKEFIANAAHEKSFIFIVVNRFDNIKDKSRCMRRILDQVADLSPQTHKDARDFVHFVSSKNVSEGSSGSGGDDGDDGDDDGNGPPPPLPDGSDPNFDQLEESLRNFVLQKRSLSKLAPAKTYLNNILLDLEILSEVNIKFSQAERDLRLNQLDDMNPKFEKSLCNSVKVTERIDTDIENVTDRIYEYTVKHLNKVLSETGQLPSVKYTSIFDAYNYANNIRSAIIQRIQDAVYDCELHARKQTSITVNSIKALGILHLGDQPAFMKLFKEDAMFSRRRDTLARSIRADLSISDFLIVSVPKWVTVITSPITSTMDAMFAAPDVPAIESPSVDIVSGSTVNNALTIASVVGGTQVVLRSSWLANTFHAMRWIDFQLVRRLFVPAIVVGSACGVAYIISEIPNSVPKNVSRKVAREVINLGYVHANADRISKESRKVLKYPAQDVRAGFQSNIESQAREREEFEKSAKEAQAGYEYFTRLHADAAHQRAEVEKCNLEAPLEVD